MFFSFLTSIFDKYEIGQKSLLPNRFLYADARLKITFPEMDRKGISMFNTMCVDLAP